MRRFYVFFCIAVVFSVSAGCDESSEKGDPSIEWIYIDSANGPTFQNGWSNSFNAGDQDLAIGIDSEGFLHIVGTIEDSSTTTVSELVFTLPEGYRPVKAQYSFITGWNAGYVTCSVSVLPNGGFYIGGPSPSSTYLGHLIVKLD